MNNTLLLGNGINLTLYSDAPDWAKLYKEDKKFDIRNYTFLYEACLLNTKESDDDFKQRIADEIKEKVRIDKIKPSVNDIDRIGELLKKHDVSNLITTNVDTCLESLLSIRNGFYTEDSKWSTERVYSIRRNKHFRKDDYSINMWKMHGDVENVKTISLGYDQYCGSLSKIEAYIKGGYTGKEVKNTISMKEKCKDNSLFDDYSWIELFFKTNVYIACFGMDFSEIDIWWILNKRKRFIKEGIPVKNNIVFLYSKYDNGDNETDIKKKEVKILDFSEKRNMLETFGVDCREIEAGDGIISSIFQQIL